MRALALGNIINIVKSSTVREFAHKPSWEKEKIFFLIKESIFLFTVYNLNACYLICNHAYLLNISQGVIKLLINSEILVLTDSEKMTYQ